MIGLSVNLDIFVWMRSLENSHFSHRWFFGGITRAKWKSG